MTVRIVGIIQARVSSARHPGKMLRSLYGRPMIAWVIDVAQRAEAAGALNAVGVATSTDVSDDPLALRAMALGVPVHRGPLDDVARRLLDAATALNGDAFVRVNGDSPLLDSSLVVHAVELFRSGHYDLVTNVAARSFPKGQSVEVVSCAALRAALSEMATPEEREHVTRYFYLNERKFRIASFSAEPPMPQLQMSVDTPEDFARCEAVIASYKGDIGHLSWREMAARYLAQGAAL